MCQHSLSRRIAKWRTGLVVTLPEAIPHHAGWHHSKSRGMTLNHGYRYRHVLGREASGHSTLSYLVGHFTHSNAAEWQARFAAGEVLLDDTTAQGAEPLRAGAVLIWNRPGWEEEEETPQTFGVIYQDAHLLVVDKPSGLPTIPGGGFYLNTLLSLVQVDFPEARPLHRLGRATSGLVLFALNAPTASTLSRCWPQVHKQYRALACGVALLDYTRSKPRLVRWLTRDSGTCMPPASLANPRAASLVSSNVGQTRRSSKSIC